MHNFNCFIGCSDKWDKSLAACEFQRPKRIVNKINIRIFVLNNNIIPHRWRPLKTVNSKGLIPLVGASYETIKILHRQRTNPFLFNTYTDQNGCKDNSCSAALNKWLKQHVPDAVVHSFKHSFRDRLRNAGVQSEMIDQLGDWSNNTVGQGYGNGYKLYKMHEAISSI